jgi:hypothetical protein
MAELRSLSELRARCGLAENRYAITVQPVCNSATPGMGGRECNSPLPLGLHPKLQLSTKG